VTVRSRPLPLAALVLAVATAIAASVVLSGPAGAVVSADPDNGTCRTNGRVNAVAYLGGTIYLGGSFTAVDGRPRNRLAACNASDGSLLSWNPSANNVVRALKVSPAGTRVYVGGHFTTIGGASRGHLAALRTSGGGLDAWDPGANGVFGAFGPAITSSRVAFGGEFTQAGGEAHQGLVQFSGTP
jgi:hypothetical protein